MIKTFKGLRGTATLYLGDCLEILPTLDGVDAVVADPPYGISLDCQKEASGGIGRQEFDPIIGDNEKFNPIPFMGFEDVILFGCNHFCDSIPPLIGQWYFWDKTLQNNGCRIAEGEFLWHKKGTKPRAFRHLWSGAYRASESGQTSVHPSQKPIALLAWCLDVARLPTGATVLDPYMGSGTTGIACLRTGRNFIGIEIDPKHYATACDRMAREIDGELL